MFIFVLKTGFLAIKSNKNIKRLIIFDQEFLDTAYTDDTTFFLKDKEPVFEISKILNFLWFLEQNLAQQNAKLLVFVH